MKTQSENIETKFKELNKSNSSFKVPNGYFDKLEDEILLKVSKEPRHVEPKVVPFTSSNPYKWIGVLAVAASMIWAVFIFSGNEAPINTNISIVDIEMEYYEIDEYLLAENISEEELSEFSIAEDYLTEDELYNFIISENYSEFLITENL